MWGKVSHAYLFWGKCQNFIFISTLVSTSKILVLLIIFNNNIIAFLFILCTFTTRISLVYDVSYMSVWLICPIYFLTRENIFILINWKCFILIFKLWPSLKNLIYFYFLINFMLFKDSIRSFCSFLCTATTRVLFIPDVSYILVWLIVWFIFQQVKIYSS